MVDAPTVAIFPHQAHCYAFGGFEIQMLDAARAARNSGANIVLQNWWDRSREAPIVHHWGLGYPHINNLLWAKACGQKIVVTTLVPYYSTAWSRMRGYAGALLAEGRIVRKGLRLADCVVVLNDLQAEVVVDYYKIDSRRVAVIPNIVPDHFFEEGDRPLLNSAAGYWLIAGNVCHRKNQLGAAEAAINAGVSLVIVGSSIPGEEEYAQRLRKLIATSTGVVWKPEMQRDSKEYLQLLKGACGLILPSRSEHQPIIALEMAALGKPIILGDRDYGRQAIFDGAYLVDPESVDDMAAAMRRIRSDQTVGMAGRAINQARSKAVGDAYLKVYHECLRGGGQSLSS